MKSLLAASPVLLLAGAMLAAPVSAQTIAPPYANQPIAQPYAGQATQPEAVQNLPQQPLTSGNATEQQTASGTLPQGPYLSECKEVRMLQDTLTAFCPRGDGTWHTTQMWHASSCPGSVQVAGGDLICGGAVGSTNPAETYSSSSGSTFAAPVAPSFSNGVYGTGPQATGAYPGNNTVAPQSYAAPTDNAYGAYGYNHNPAYPPPANPYVAPSGMMPARPPY